jgi:hypothetical protein
MAAALWAVGTSRTRHTAQLVVAGPFVETCSGSVTGRIALAIGGRCFPEAQWRDFVVVLSESWAAAWHALERTDSTVLRFIDGPFDVFIRATGGGMVAAELISRVSGAPHVDGAFTVSRQHLRHALANGFAETAELLRQGGRRVDAEIVRRAMASIRCP